MPAHTANEEALFAPIVAVFAKDARVELPARGDGAVAKTFGARGLKVGGKVFAMMSGGKLVVKLPKDRVAALVAGKKGEPFVLGPRVMKEWVAIPVRAKASWRALAEEARAFVSG